MRVADLPMKRCAAIALLAPLWLLGCRSREVARPELVSAPSERTASIDGGARDAASPERDAVADGSADAGGAQRPPRSVDGPFSRVSRSVYFFVDEDVFEPGSPETRPNAVRTFAAPATRSGHAPPMRGVLEALRTTLATNATFALDGGFNALGDGRFVAVVRRTDRANPVSPVILVVVASELDGRAQLEAIAEVPTKLVAESQTTCMLTVRGRELRDFDNDGELELALSVSYCGPVSCPFGHRTFESLVVFDLSPIPSIAVMVQRHYSGDAADVGRRALRTRWTDVNNDGHGDIVVVGEDCGFIAPDPNDNSDEGDTRTAAQLGCARRVAARGPDNAFEDSPIWCCIDRREVALYNAAIDAWRPANAGATVYTPVPCSE